ncbi:MAG: DUF262 domain-containing protein [Candidatus Sericytochromatia bacterium]|nr:DUF262 domain-containing protein [Candidatus Sericytochromatia bacterium]
MDEPFKPQSLSVEELFGNKDALYKIPQYQRPYKWEDEQVEKLWDDLFEAYQNGEKNYFLGSVITARPAEDERSAYLDVVDGQQRLTTLMILFCVLRDLYPDLNAEQAHTEIRTVDRETIDDAIMFKGKSSRLKLFTHRQHQSDFESLIIHGHTSTLNKPKKYEIRSDEEPKYKFINTAVILRQKLETLGATETGQFMNYVFHQVQIIRIDCQHREFAIKLFQVLNDRGLDLTPADLIKSFLLEKLYKRHKEDPETSQLREEQFISDWREMEQTIKGCDINLNDAFILYEYYLLGQNPKKSLYDELQAAFKDQDPNQVIGDLKRFVSTYYQEIYEAHDTQIYAFRYLRWNMYWKTILLTGLHTGYKEMESLKKQLNRFYYLYWLAGKTLSQIKQTSFNLIKWIKEQRSMAEISDELNKKLSADGIVAQALRNLCSEQVASEPWIKPLLLIMEYNATDQSKLAFIELSQDVHLEHILPVKYAKYPEWGHISSELASKWLNSAGNLTLLGGAKNIEASNNPFAVKMEVYQGKGKYDEKNEKVTAFAITQQILRDFEQKTFSREWSEAALKDRWQWFFKELGEILQIETSTAQAAGQPTQI